jgi:hypothetical protein
MYGRFPALTETLLIQAGLSVNYLRPAELDLCWPIAEGSLMDPKFELVLNSLPPKKARCRLEPYRELIILECASLQAPLTTL